MDPVQTLVRHALQVLILRDRCSKHVSVLQVVEGEIPRKMHI